MLRPLWIVAVAIGLLAFYLFVVREHEAKAAEPHEVPTLIVRIETGVCGLDAYGKISEDPKKTIHFRDCHVGINPYEPTKIYFSTIGTDGKRESVIETDMVTGAQIIIWHKGQKRI